jgi:hypothetical protein
MATIEVSCKCGWFVRSNNGATITVATSAHDEVCAYLQARFKIAPSPRHGLTQRNFSKETK